MATAPATRLPPVTARLTWDGTAILVHVEHDARQSYSRVVYPKARRTAQAVPVPGGGRWSFDSVDYGPIVKELNGRRPVTVYRFVPGK